MPRLLDLYCGEGGATAGYQHVGFEVWGVDWHKMPRYCGEHFSRGNVLELPLWFLCAFDAIHASPPCQKYSALSNGTWGDADDHADWIGPTREMLRATGLPYVIENVVGAPLIDPIMLCGSMFDLRIERGYLRRHRLFESNVKLYPEGFCEHEGTSLIVAGHGAAGGPMRGRGTNSDERRRLMEMPWATRDGIAQAIPPRFSECIGSQLLAYV